MRLILMGTGSFAVPTFRALLDSSHDVAAIVTRPVPPARGRQKGPVNPVLATFAATGIPVLDPLDINDAAVRARLAQWNPDLFVVCDYGQILSSQTLAVSRRGGVNLHGSLLPKYRGAAPVNWAIWQGESETGVTVIHMTPHLDGGPCLAVARTAIGPEDDAPALEHRLSLMGVQPVLQAIDMLAAWDGQAPLGTRQDAALRDACTSLEEIPRRSGLVTNRRQPGESGASSATVARHLHAMAAQAHPMHLLLEQVSIDDLATPTAGVAPGSVVRVDGQVIAVATGQGCLAIHRLKPAGKRVMDAGEFLRGYPVQVGERFGTAVSDSSP